MFKIVHDMWTYFDYDLDQYKLKLNHGLDDFCTHVDHIYCQIFIHLWIQLLWVDMTILL